MLADTLGRPPRLSAGLGYTAGSLVCSWSGQPGSVTVWMTDDAAVISRFLDRHPVDQDVPVTGDPAGVAGARVLQSQGRR